MLRGGTVGRRLGLGLAVVSVAAMLGTGIALAASDVIVGGPTESFSAATFNTDQGEVVQFRNDGGSHNVTARQNGPDGKALFRSATISGGTTPVNGTQYLSSGDYAFLCTVHPSTMNGTLRVTGAGNPVPRPQATLTPQGKSLAKALKKGIRLNVTANSSVQGVTFTAKLGKATIGRATTSLVAGAQSKLVKLSKAGKAKLRGKSKATVTVSAEIPFGPPASAKVKLT
jgi:plastocyanin